MHSAKGAWYSSLCDTICTPVLVIVLVWNVDLKQSIFRARNSGLRSYEKTFDIFNKIFNIPCLISLNKGSNPSWKSFVSVWASSQPGSKTVFYIFKHLQGNIILRPQPFSYALLRKFNSFIFIGITQLSKVLQHIKDFKLSWDSHWISLRPRLIPQHPKMKHWRVAF